MSDKTPELQGVGGSKEPRPKRRYLKPGEMVTIAKCGGCELVFELSWTDRDNHTCDMCGGLLCKNCSEHCRDCNALYCRDGEDCTSKCENCGEECCMDCSRYHQCSE
jgi:hypothetical protein